MDKLKLNPKAGEYIWPQAKSPTGHIHEVVVVRQAGRVRFHPTCNKQFDLATDGWFNHWKGIRAKVTCKKCLRAIIEKAKS